jgi:hypothetical protein
MSTQDWIAAQSTISSHPARYRKQGERSLLLTIERIERLARLLDSEFRVPGTDFRFGLDGMLGLLPVVGDAVTGLLSTYLIAEAARVGARKHVLFRMGWNVAVDAFLGSIPILGDIFDFGFKANRRNANIAIRELEYLARGGLS